MSENAFKNIESDENIPDSVKKEMLSNLDTIKLVADFVDLFFIKGSSVIGKSLTSDTGIEEQESGKRKSD